MVLRKSRLQINQNEIINNFKIIYKIFKIYSCLIINSFFFNYSRNVKRSTSNNHKAKRIKKNKEKVLV